MGRHLLGPAHAYEMEIIMQIRMISSGSSFRPQDSTRRASRASGADKGEREQR